MTQQNAALVEQSAAAAESLKDQARQLATAIASFKLGGTAAATPPPKAVARQVIQRASTTRATAVKSARPKAPARTVAARPAPVIAPQPKAAPQARTPTGGGVSDEWESF
jgi:methyl-accepting chemotaxis protein